jgi:mRNA-degrading endonuclease RelE of RelBE toxin-antitoxin system
LTRNVRYTGRAERDLEQIPEPDRRVVLTAVRVFAAGGIADIKKLQGMIGVYRLRCGRWRVIFELPSKEALILRVRDRKDFLTQQY